MVLLGGHFTGTPEQGLGLAETKRVAFNIGLEGTRREPANGNGPPEHWVELTANMHR